MREVQVPRVLDSRIQQKVHRHRLRRWPQRPHNHAEISEWDLFADTTLDLDLRLVGCVVVLVLVEKNGCQILVARQGRATKGIMRGDIGKDPGLRCLARRRGFNGDALRYKTAQLTLQRNVDCALSYRESESPSFLSPFKHRMVSSPV